VRRAYALIESHGTSHGMLALIVYSGVPGLTSLLTRFAQARVPRIVQTKIQRYAFRRAPNNPRDWDLSPACFALLEKSSVRLQMEGGVRHWMDGARAGFFSITDGQSHRLPCGGYCGLLYPATLFRNPDCGVQDRVRTACTQPSAFGGAADKAGPRDLASLIDPDTPRTNPCCGAARLNRRGRNGRSYRIPR
jgi:hypothetical protein